MLELLLFAAAQVQTINLPPAQPTGEVATISVKPDLVVKEIRIQDDKTMHVLVANIGTGAVGQYFPVRASVEISGESRDIYPGYSKPLDAGAEGWVTLGSDWRAPLIKAASATAVADEFPPPKPRGWFSFGPSFPSLDSWLYSTFPDMKKPCKEYKGCVVEANEGNNSYAVAGVPRGTPERLNATDLAPVMVPERG